MSDKEQRNVIEAEAASRLRAAFAYAKPTFSKKERAAVLGVSERTIGRWQHQADLSPEQWARLADVTGVPLWFFQEGFTVQPESLEPTVAERLEALERKVESLVRQSGADERRQPPGDLGRAARGSTPSPPHPEQSDSDKAEDSRQGSGEA